jgi:two-component system, sensor histidine kinase
LARTKPESRETDAQKALDFFELKSTPNGRFLHYCWQRSGRKQFLSRFLFCALICGTVGLLEDIFIGVTALLLISTADLLDCLWLRHVWARWRRDLVPGRIYRNTVAMAAMQSSANVIAAWYAVSFLQPGALSHDGSVEMFGLICFFAISLNAGLHFPYVPTIAKLKLGITVVGFVAIAAGFLVQVGNVTQWLQMHAYIISATTVLAFVAMSFTRMVFDSFQRNNMAQRRLLRSQVELERATTEAKEREQQANWLALIAENTNESIIVTDPLKRIVWTNAAFTQITGFSRDEVIGRTPTEVLDTEETDVTAIVALDDMRTTKQKGQVEILNRFKDGSVHWISTSMTPVFDDDGDLLMCISVERDVTEEKRKTKELAEANEKSQAAVLAKERFFATMSHEIRTPMNGVLGMTDVLSRTPLNAEQNGYVTTIRESGHALLGIINDILDLSKLQSGKVLVNIAAFDLADAVKGVACLLGPLATAKGISLKVLDGTDGPTWVMGDAGRLRQILMNLVGNAIKFTSVGEVTLSLERGQDDRFRFHVADTGIGITPDRLEAIFDSFTQADSAIDRQYGGTGLGLTISRMLARAMGGEVTVVSQPKCGSVFTLSVPLPAAVREAPETQAVQEPAVQEAFARQKRILVAEDNGTNRLILRKMLEPSAALLTEVVNGAQAVAAYEQSAPDLIIMDMQMPVMDGLTAIREIRQKERAMGRPRCPIMVLSANVFQDDVHAGYAADCDDYLTKPVQRAALLASAARLLGQMPAEQALSGALRLA